MNITEANAVTTLLEGIDGDFYQDNPSERTAALVLADRAGKALHLTLRPRLPHLYAAEDEAHS